MSKKVKAIEIFNNIVAENPQLDAKSIRTMVIDQLISQLDMTAAGAATYYAMAKKPTTPAMVKPATPAPVTKSTSSSRGESIDNRQLYTVCYIEDGVVSRSGSYYDYDDAVKFETSDTIIVKSSSHKVPAIGTNASELIPYVK